MDELRSDIPITLSINHLLLGANEETICDACSRGEHWDCCMATWCMCEDDGDGDPDYDLGPWEDPCP